LPEVSHTKLALLHSIIRVFIKNARVFVKYNVLLLTYVIMFLIMKRVLIVLAVVTLCATGVVVMIVASKSSKENEKDIIAVEETQGVVKYRKISAEEAKQIIDSDNSYILLDVRTEEEFTEKHIAGAILIPDYEIVKRAKTELPDKNIQILVYCRRGNRSATVARQLIRMSYTNVYDIGGIIDWPYEIVTPDTPAGID
jgi:rhodanese-related sulfurtransferase